MLKSQENLIVTSCDVISVKESDKYFTIKCSNIAKWKNANVIELSYLAISFLMCKIHRC